MSIGKYKKGSLKSDFKRLGTKNTIDFDLSNTELVLSDYIDTVIQRLQQNLIKHHNNATNTLSQSFNPLPITFKSGAYTIELKYEGYGEDVDKGTKSQGFTKEKRNKLVPQIRIWISAKNELHRLASTKAEQKSLAYAISTNILKNGTKGSHWLTEIIGENGQKLELEMSAAISKILNKDVEIQVTKQAQSMLNGNNSNR